MLLFTIDQGIMDIIKELNRFTDKVLKRLIHKFLELMRFILFQLFLILVFSQIFGGKDFFRIEDSSSSVKAYPVKSWIWDLRGDCLETNDIVNSCDFKAWEPATFRNAKLFRLMRHSCKPAS